MSVVVGAWLLLAPPAFATTPGALVQLQDQDGCIQGTPADGCAFGRVLGLDITAIAASPDGQNVYVTNGEVTNLSAEVGAVLVYSRQPGGALAQSSGPDGCIGGPGIADDVCRSGRALGGAKDIAVSPDGKNVYVAASGANAIAVLDRAPDGTLTQAEDDRACISQDGFDGAGGSATCRDGRGLEGARAVVVSPDGENVYAIGGHEDINAVAVFDRDPADGSLTQPDDTAGCISDQGLDGDKVDAVPTRTCDDGRWMFEPTDLAVSNDGLNVYVAISEAAPNIDFHGPGAVVVLERNAADGTVTQPAGTDGCLANNDELGLGEPDCTEATGLHDALAIAISPDDDNVYVAAQGESGESQGGEAGALTVFGRDGAGHLGQLPGKDGCVSNSGHSNDTGGEGRCATAVSFREPSGVAISDDGANVYVMAEDDATIASFTRGATGAVTQLPGTEGCISDNGSPGGDPPQNRCDDGRALRGVTKMAIVGCTAYTISPDSAAVDAFRRCVPASTSVPDCSPSGDLTIAVTDPAGGTAAKKAHFRIDGGAEQTSDTSAGNPGSATVSAPAEGSHTVEFWGEDEQRVVEDVHHTVTLVVDRTSPTVEITSDQGKTQYALGETATVSTTALDDGSGLTSDPSGRNQPIPTDTAGDQSVSRTAQDKCGNTKTTVFRYTVTGFRYNIPSGPPPCKSLRVIKIRLAKSALKGAKVKSVRLTLRGKRLKVTRSGRRLRVTVNLRGLRAGRYTIKIRVKLSDGRTLKGKQRYHTCSKRRPGGHPRL